MYMALAFESFQCRVLCKKESVVRFDARYVVCDLGGPRPATESQTYIQSAEYVVQNAQL
jgi:hypothetical protein